MKTLKILLYNSGEIFTDNLTGGIRRFRELAYYLASGKLKVNGIRVDSDLCCADDQKILRKYGLVSAYQMRGNTGKPFILPELQRYALNKNVLREIRDAKYDAVVVFDVPQAIGLCLAGIANIVLMIRKDMIGYEVINSSRNRGIKKRVKFALQWVCEYICLKRAMVIVCQCKYDKKVLLRRHRVLAQKIKNNFVIQINNVNPSWICESSKVGDSGSDQYENKLKVYFIGGFDNPRKGQDVFLDTAEQILKERQDISFHLIGGGAGLEEYKRKYSCQDIQFLGRKESPINELSRADLLVVPSFADSCPNTVLEGLYSHTPVIGSNAGGIPEILMDRNALFEPNSNSLKKKIIELADDGEKIRCLVHKQEKRKSQLEFNWAQIILTRALEKRPNDETGNG